LYRRDFAAHLASELADGLVTIAVDVRVEVLFREADASPDLHGGDPALLPENSNVSFGGVEVGGSLLLIEEASPASALKIPYCRLIL